jgi:hypothetical protein
VVRIRVREDECINARDAARQQERHNTAASRVVAVRARTRVDQQPAPRRRANRKRIALTYVDRVGREQCTSPPCAERNEDRCGHAARGTGEDLPAAASIRASPRGSHVMRCRKPSADNSIPSASEVLAGRRMGQSGGLGALRVLEAHDLPGAGEAARGARTARSAGAPAVREATTSWSSGRVSGLDGLTPYS